MDHEFYESIEQSRSCLNLGGGLIETHDPLTSTPLPINSFFNAKHFLLLMLLLVILNGHNKLVTFTLWARG